LAARESHGGSAAELTVGRLSLDCSGMDQLAENVNRLGWFVDGVEQDEADTAVPVCWCALRSMSSAKHAGAGLGGARRGALKRGQRHWEGGQGRYPATALTAIGQRRYARPRTTTFRPGHLAGQRDPGPRLPEIGQ
jgi:hypothetical protein